MTPFSRKKYQPIFFLYLNSFSFYLLFFLCLFLLFFIRYASSFTHLFLSLLNLCAFSRRPSIPVALFLSLISFYLLSRRSCRQFQFFFSNRFFALFDCQVPFYPFFSEQHENLIKTHLQPTSAFSTFLQHSKKCRTSVTCCLLGQ